MEKRMWALEKVFCFAKCDFYNRLQRQKLELTSRPVRFVGQTRRSSRNARGDRIELMQAKKMAARDKRDQH